MFLPGRNVLLLSKAMLWCHLHGVPEVALAPLESNPFPDATPAFFAAFEAVVNQAVGGRVRVLQPYLNLHKADVLRRGRDLPLELTFSCIRPRDGPALRGVQQVRRAAPGLRRRRACRIGRRTITERPCSA